MNRFKGFTLIELLITVSILSALLLTGTYMYQILANRWEKEVGKYQSTVNLSRNLKLINGVFKGLQPYIVLDYDAKPPVPGMLFIGHSERLLAITQQGIFSDKYPEIFRLILEPNGDDTYNLIYQAASFKNLLLLTAQQDINFEHSYLMFERIDRFNIRYLGWDNIIVKAEKNTTGATPTWRDDFSGLNSQMLPDEIEVQIEIEGEELVFQSNIERNSLRFLSPYLEASHDFE